MRCKLPQCVRFLPGRLLGRIQAMPSKSESHRCFIAATLAGHPCCVDSSGSGSGPGCDDVWATIKAYPPGKVVDCGESGATLRFLLPLLCMEDVLQDGIEVIGSGRLPERPIADLLNALRVNGAVIKGDKLPLYLSGGLHGGRFTLPGDKSSQYVTGLLFALPLLPQDSVIELTSPLESAEYVEMTLDVLRRCGIRVERLKNGFAVPGRQRYSWPGENLHVGGDWSNAAVWLCAGALGDNVEVEGLSDALQGDRAVLNVLRRFGAETGWRGELVYASGARLHGCGDVDMREIPDLLPVLAVTAAAAEGETRFVNAGRLRLKESDRLDAMSRLLHTLGVDVAEGPDWLAVRGHGRICGGEVDSAGDHRIVMAAALAGTMASAPVVVTGFPSISKSYPDFLGDYCKLGGRCHVI